MTGRPSLFTEELAEEFCERIADGRSLRSITTDDDMPDQRTIRRWLKDREGFRLQYAIARDLQADCIAEETKDIADGTDDPQKARLQIDARKWYASKLAPKKYGDKVTQEVSGPDGGPIPTKITVEFVKAG
jgi:hypothetical protein